MNLRDGDIILCIICDDVFEYIGRSPYSYLEDAGNNGLTINDSIFKFPKKIIKSVDSNFFKTHSKTQKNI